MYKLWPKKRKENSIAKKKNDVGASTYQGRKSTGLDYCDKDGIDVEAIELTQEANKETNLRKLQS